MEKHSITFTIPSNSSTNTAYAFCAIQNSTGEAWFDCVQLEEGSVANKYNLIENGNVENGTGTPTSWTTSACDVNDTLVTVSGGGHPVDLGTKAFRINGNPSDRKLLTQKVYVNGSAGDVFTYSGWAKADAVPDDSRVFSLTVGIRNNDGTATWRGLRFNADASDWQFLSTKILANKDYYRLDIYVLYYYQENTAYFDGLSLFKESFGQSYAYDSDGNITSAKDLAEKQSSFNFNDSNDLTSMKTPKNNTFTYGYDSNHNVTGAETAKGIDYSFTYDSYGNNTTSKVYDASGANAGFIEVNALYDSNGNYINTVTDARSKTTDYDYNTTNGTLTKVMDANGNEVCYSYDSNLDRLDYVWLDTTANGTWDSNEPKNTYSYIDDRLDKVTVNGFDYDFDYDALGNLDIVKVGSQTLINNDYDLSKGLLDGSTYGNGDTVDYVYDDLDRVSSLNYDGGATPEFEYFYNASGMIGYMVDNENGVEYRYLYDEANRPGSIVRDNGITSWYKYDDNLSAPTTTEYFYESIDDNNDTYETEYKNDEDGRPTSTIISVDDGTEYKVGYSYDYLSRPTSKKYYTDTTEEYKEEYTYLAGGYGANSTTTLVSQIEYNDTDTLSYEYNDVGYITKVQKDANNYSEYRYNELGELVRENFKWGGTSYTLRFIYNEGGNITRYYRYAFAAGDSDPGTRLGSQTWTYDSTWDDKLVGYNGQTITYDSIGNPLTYDGWTYTWKWGRRLATSGNTSQGISTSYKYNDSGIRTQKTVTDNGSTTTYKYNLMGSKITYEERTGANACEMYYAYDNAGKLYGFYYDGASNDGFYFYKRNLQGDIIGILNSSGTEVTTYTYDVWGKLVSTTGTLASTIGADNPFRYRGYYYDDEISLYYLNQRYYNPRWRRFINADTFMGQTGGVLSHNVYAYCGNNPVMRNDPSGRDWYQFEGYGSEWTFLYEGTYRDNVQIVYNANLPEKQKGVLIATAEKYGYENVYKSPGGNIVIKTGWTKYLVYMPASNIEDYIFQVGETISRYDTGAFVGGGTLIAECAQLFGAIPYLKWVLVGCELGTFGGSKIFSDHLRRFEYYNNYSLDDINGYGALYEHSTSFLNSFGKPFKYYPYK